MARKMVMISEDVLNKLRNVGDSTRILELNDVPSLDEEMKRILEKAEITQSEKLTLYNQTLQRHLKTKKDVVESNEDKSVVKKQTNWLSEIANAVPSSSVNDGISLYNWISRQKGITWSETGELEINGHGIAGSNVIDLVYDGIRKTKSQVDPIGFDIFYKLLYKYNAPKKIIKNPSRIKFINSISSLNTTKNVKGAWIYV